MSETSAAFSSDLYRSDNPGWRDEDIRADVTDRNFSMIALEEIGFADVLRESSTVFPIVF